MEFGEGDRKPNIVIGGIYDHCLGASYQVNEVVIHAEARDVTGGLTRDIIFSKLTDDEVNSAGTKYSLSEREFLNGTTEIDGVVVPIFTLRPTKKSLVSREEFSKGMFGRVHAVDVAQTIMRFTVEPPEPFKASTIRAELKERYGIPESSSQTEIKWLEELKVIVETLPPPGENRRAKYYIRLEHLFWRLMEASVRATERPGLPLETSEPT